MRITLAAFLLLTTAPCAYCQDSASHAAAVYDLFLVLNVEENMEKVVDIALDGMLKSNPKFQNCRDLIREFLIRYLGWNALREDLARLYLATFSEQEVREIAAFYRTPSGKKTITVLPALMQRVSELGRERVQQHFPELEEAMNQRQGELKKTPENEDH